LPINSAPIDTHFLESLLGYNARRAALVAIEQLLHHFVLSLIHHNEGITSRQLCRTLGLHPPNLVGIVAQFEKRQLITKRPHPDDKRASGLYLTSAARAMMKKAERAAQRSERAATANLSDVELTRLIFLLQKVYKETT
jgi:DNA-binding MarR family transcriptional regulator